MRSTIKEVAKKSHVSIATVSRVFNQSEKVKESTRARVLVVSKALKYSPNAAARGLIMRRTEGIGLLLPDLHGEFFSEVIRGADQAAQVAGYHLIVSSSHSSREQIEFALRLMRGRVDGLIVMSPQVDSDTLLEHLPQSLPVVVLNSLVNSRHYDCISTDGFTGAREMVEYLIALGHRRIAIICGTPDNREAMDRLHGYRTALSQHDIPNDPTLEIPGDFSESAGQGAITQLAGLWPRVTAVFAANDTTAIGALGASQEAGIRVPDDLSICGFDDIPVAKYLRPALTTVHVPISELGAQAVDHLMGRIRAKRSSEPVNIVVSTRLAIRSSCAKPAASSSRNLGEAAA